MAIEIEKEKTVELERKGENVQTDVYKVKYTEGDAPDGKQVEEKLTNGMTIGCPKCNLNTFAFFKDDEYTCAICLEHSSEITDNSINRGFLKESLH